MNAHTALGALAGFGVWRGLDRSSTFSMPPLEIPPQGSRGEKVCAPHRRLQAVLVCAYGANVSSVLRRYDVLITAHDIATALPRHRQFSIPQREFVIGAMSKADAMRQAIVWAHRDVGAPIWRPYCRQSVPHCFADLHVETAAEAVQARRATLERDRAAAAAA